jgi:DNA-binding NtrC family response regulator
MSILIVDDDANVRNVFAAMLKPLKLLVIEAGNGIAGLALFREYRPSLVITDIIMPEMDGIELLREIRSIDPEAHIVAMSGGGGGRYSDPLALARDLGAAETLSKPVDVQKLRSTVTRLLQRTHEARHTPEQYAPPVSA